MLYPVQMQYGMPAVGALPQLTIAQAGKIQADLRIRTSEQSGPNWNHRRQNLRCPENGLFDKGSIGVSCEKPTPIGVGIRYSRHDRSDNPAGDQDCGVSIPRPN